MKTMLNKLAVLADGLDALGLKKDADVLDKIIARAARGDEFEDYTKLFDEPLELELNEEKGPGEERVVLEEPEVHTPLEEEEAPLEKERDPKRVRYETDFGPGPEMHTNKDERKQLLKRRLEILKLKKQLEQAEKEEAEEDKVMPSDEVKLPVATREDLIKSEEYLDSFEDEENEASDSGIPDDMCEGCFGKKDKDGVCKTCKEMDEQNEREQAEYNRRLESDPEFAAEEEAYLKKMDEESARDAAARLAEKEEAIARGLVECKRCGDMVPPGRMHYPGNDPENDYGHKPDAEPDDMGFADDGGLIDKLKDVLKGAPELAKQLLQLVKDNPELLELLAL